jgi:23S rRNA pseudouridine2605 synthase/23S rRNA pseudouridine2604 synthase
MKIIYRMSQIRLNKFIQQKGLASRRGADDLIAKGAVKVNGKIVTEMGSKIDPGVDKVEFENKVLNELDQNRVYYKLNKPTGLECVIKDDPHGTIYEVMPDIEDGVTYVGRLDKMSEGLLLMSNDGRLVYKMTHPKFEKEKEYEVTAARPVFDSELEALQEDFVMDGYVTRPAKVYRISSRKFGIILKEGRNRQIRRMCRRFDIKIHKLKRIRAGEITIGNLEPGEYAKLSAKEMEYIKRVLEQEA